MTGQFAIEPHAAAPRGSAAPSAPEFAEFERSLRRVALPAIAAMAAVGIYAAFELQPLFVDGFDHLVKLLAMESFFTSAPARRAVEWIRQWPLLAAIELGASDRWALAVLYGASIKLLPLALTLLAWAVLPKGKKHFFVFPLLHYFAGTAGAEASPIAEGSTAAALFWNLYFYLLFRCQSTRSVDFFAVMAAPAVVLHEAMIFLAPILSAAAVWRARHEPRRGERIAFIVFAAWFVAVAAVQAHFIFDPRYPGHGARYLASLLAGGWMVGGSWQINVPAAVGLAGLAMLAFLVVFERVAGGRRRQFVRYAGAVFAVLAAAAVAAVFAIDGMLALTAQYGARNQALFVSLPLALAAFHAAARPAEIRIAVLRQAIALVAVMAAVSAVWHANATLQWSRYVATIRGILETNRGFVEWSEAVATLPPDRRRLVGLLTHEWTLSPMSIAFARERRITTIIGHRDFQGGRPFDPLDLAKLPRSRFWDTAPYREAVAGKLPETGPRR